MYPSFDLSKTLTRALDYLLMFLRRLSSHVVVLRHFRRTKIVVIRLRHRPWLLPRILALLRAWLVVTAASSLLYTIIGRFACPLSTLPNLRDPLVCLFIAPPTPPGHFRMTLAIRHLETTLLTCVRA